MSYLDVSFPISFWNFKPKSTIWFFKNFRFLTIFSSKVRCMYVKWKKVKVRLGRRRDRVWLQKRNTTTTTDRRGVAAFSQGPNPLSLSPLNPPVRLWHGPRRNRDRDTYRPIFPSLFNQPSIHSIPFNSLFSSDHIIMMALQPGGTKLQQKYFPWSILDQS